VPGDVLTDKKSLNNQAEFFTYYLLKKKPNRAVTNLYHKIILNNVPKLSSKDAKILKFGLRHPKTLGPLDTYLALAEPYCELRRRIYIMFAVLESSPDYAQDFLPVKRGAYFWLVVAARGLKSFCWAIFGFILVQVVGAGR